MTELSRLRAAISEYAAFNAKHAMHEVPRADVAWKLRQILETPRCWCGAEVGPRVPGSPDAGCLADIMHDITAEAPTTPREEVTALQKIEWLHSPQPIRGTDPPLQRCAVCNEHREGPYPCRTIQLLTEVRQEIERDTREKLLAEVRSWHVYESRDTGDVYPAESVIDRLEESPEARE